MSNARVLLEMSADGEVVPTGRGGRGMLTLRFVEVWNPRWVLEPDRNPRILVVMRRRSINFQEWHTLEVFLVRGE
jgi:hypothetical protein